MAVSPIMLGHRRQVELEYYTSETGQLPPYLHYTENHRLQFEPQSVLEGEAGPFDLVASFGHSLSHLIPPVEPDERQELMASLHQTTFFHTESPINLALQHVTHMANDPSFSPTSPTDRDLYQSHLRPVAIRVLETALFEAVAEYPTSPVIMLIPLNGARFMAETYSRNIQPYHPWPEAQIFPYRASRVILSGQGHYHVGIRFISPLPQIEDNSTVVFTDDCIAGVGTLLTSLKLLPHHDIHLKIAATVGSLRGISAIEQTLPRLGFTDFSLTIGIPIHALNQKYYLMRLNGQYAVGDMGAWLKPI